MSSVVVRVLRSHSRATATALAALLAAYQAQVDASNHAVDVANQAVDEYNNAQADITGAFQGSGDAAVAGVEQLRQQVNAVITALDRVTG